jgi:hypothetical protein
MTKKEDPRNPREYFIINTATPATHSNVGEPNRGRDWRHLVLSANEDYAELLGLQKEGKLKNATADSPVDPRLRSRAAYFHDMVHMTPEVYKYQTEKDEDGNLTGLIWIPKENREDAKAVFNALRKLDKGVEFSSMGKVLSEEELREPEAPRSPIMQPTLNKAPKPVFDKKS